MNLYDFSVIKTKTMEITKLNEFVLLSVMERLPAKELLALSQTCTTFNNLLSENDVLLNKLRFKIELWFQHIYHKDSYAIKLSSLMELVANKQIRDYNNLDLLLNGEVTNPIERDGLIAVLKAFENVKNLRLEIDPDNLHFLNGFTQVEEFDAYFGGGLEDNRPFRIPPNTRAPMTNLKKLKLITDGDNLTYFEDCTTLTDLKLHFEARYTENWAEITEDWLLKQKNLKHLEMENEEREETVKLFEMDRSEEVPFQLESLSVSSDNSGAFMDRFIGGQQYLIDCIFKEQKEDNSATRSKVLRAMLMLPQLKTLTIDTVPSITDLIDIRNTSIKKVVHKSQPSDDCSELLKDLLIICESVEVIECECVYFYTYELPSNVLHKLQLPYCYQFCYKPEAIPEDQRAFEENFLSFLRPHTQIKELMIGHKNWLQHEQFGLSLGFFKDLLRFLPKLEIMEIYNNAEAKQIYNYVSTFESQLNLLIVRHSKGKYVHSSAENSDSEAEQSEED